MSWSVRNPRYRSDNCSRNLSEARVRSVLIYSCWHGRLPCFWHKLCSQTEACKLVTRSSSTPQKSWMPTASSWNSAHCSAHRSRAAGNESQRQSGFLRVSLVVGIRWWENNVHPDRKHRLCLVCKSSQHVVNEHHYISATALCTVILKPDMQAFSNKLKTLQFDIFCVRFFC